MFTRADIIIPTRETAQCEWCSTPFTKTRPWHRFCSRAHQLKAKDQRKLEALRRKRNG